MENKIIILISAGLVLFSCGDNGTRQAKPVSYDNVRSIQEVPYRSIGNSLIMTVAQDSCEFVVFVSADGAAMTHKPKCKNH